MNHPVILETERLTLRGVDPNFIHNLFNQYSKPQIVDYLGVDESSYLHYLDMHEKGMQTHRISLFLFLLYRKEDAKPLGECGFHTWNRTHRRAEVFYLLREDEFKRQGYMKEALPAILDYGFSTLNLHRIEALIDPDNIPSLSLLRANGFTFEGTMREDYNVNGKNESSDCYSLLKQEWRP